MPQLIVIDRLGDEHVVDAQPNLTIMEALRNSGFDELLALCGGVCSCATCHIHVDPDFMDRIPDRSQDEDDLLDTSDHRNDLSRLSCQIPLTEALSGLRVTIAEED